MIAKSAATVTSSGTVAVGVITSVSARETGGVSAINVRLRKGAVGNQIVWERAVAASGTVGADFTVPIDCGGASGNICFVEISGAGAGSVTVVGL